MAVKVHSRENSGNMYVGTSLIRLPIILCRGARIIYLLCSKLKLINLLSLFVYRLTSISHYTYSRQCRKTVLLGCIYKWKQNRLCSTMTVQLEYINHLLQFFKNISYYAGIMSVTYYAQNYASIIGWSLHV